ncbi:phospholemman-like [Melanerpes formicivorus]|uniref:phospholemman-like n=1 Tax=Melanerpes formicivorus TaxID=211600 RepID=UPI00358ED59C
MRLLLSLWLLACTCLGTLGQAPTAPPADPPREATDPTQGHAGNWADPFSYDYASLRRWGLAVAAALFVTGIGVLACGKLGKFPRCRGRNRKHSYEVAET